MPNDLKHDIHADDAKKAASANKAEARKDEKAENRPPKTESKENRDIDVFEVPLIDADGNVRGKRKIKRDSKTKKPEAEKNLEADKLRLFSLIFTLERREEIAKLGPSALPPEFLKLAKESGLVLTQDYATGETIADAIDSPVLVTYEAENIIPLAEHLHSKYPQAKITICADNDLSMPYFEAVDKMRERGEPVHGVIRVPMFTNAEQKRGLTSYYDLKESRGDLSAVRKQLADLSPSLSRQKKKRRSVKMTRELTLEKKAS